MANTYTNGKDMLHPTLKDSATDYTDSHGFMNQHR
jgi:hypothetical protein